MGTLLSLVPLRTLLIWLGLWRLLAGLANLLLAVRLGISVLV